MTEEQDTIDRQPNRQANWLEKLLNTNSKQSIMNKFSIFSHPNNNCMTYMEHFTLSMSFSKKLFASSWKAMVHAFIPSLYITSTSNTILEIQNVILKNSCHEYYKWNRNDKIYNINKKSQ